MEGISDALTILYSSAAHHHYSTIWHVWCGFSGVLPEDEWNMQEWAVLTMRYEGHGKVLLEISSSQLMYCRPQTADYSEERQR